jgi:hypothetical protein
VLQVHCRRRLVRCADHDLRSCVRSCTPLPLGRRVPSRHGTLSLNLHVLVRPSDLPIRPCVRAFEGDAPVSFAIAGLAP